MKLGRELGAPNEHLFEVSERVKNGEPSISITVRELLSWFGASRRGYWIVERIREDLQKVGLVTDPDFESAYIGSTIALKLANGQSTSGSQIVSPAPALAVASTAGPDVAISLAVQSDPTYRISKLAAANNQPVSVKPDASLQEAVTLMMSHDFSQLPVMTTEREVKGVISWASIGSRLALGKTSTVVRDFMDQHQEVRSDASLFEAIGIIVQNQYVLIRGTDNRISGIVTSSDLSLQFQQLTEPFLLLGEIENHIRKILGVRFCVEELRQAGDPSDTERQINGVADLTFGEYLRLLENPDYWSKLQIEVDRKTFVGLLDRLRLIRNDVMHFDPDGIPPEDLESLRNCARFLQRLHLLGAV